MAIWKKRIFFSGYLVPFVLLPSWAHVIIITPLFLSSRVLLMLFFLVSFLFCMLADKRLYTHVKFIKYRRERIQIFVLMLEAKD